MGALLLGLTGWLVAGDKPSPPEAVLEPARAEVVANQPRHTAPELHEATAHAQEMDPPQRVELAAAPIENEEPIAAPPEPITWILGENYVEGVVLDAETREPIPHAHVRMQGTPVLATETAEDGTFRLESPEFVYTISIQAKGYALQRHYPLRLSLLLVDERGYVFLLEPGGQLQGVALKDDGSPVTTGVVRAYEHQFFPVIAPTSMSAGAPPMLTGWRKEAPEVISGSRSSDFVYSLAPTAPLDENGHFHFDSLLPGTPQHLAVWSNEVLLDIHDEPPLAPGEVREIKLTSRQASSLTGTIELPNGVIPEISELWFTLKRRNPLVPFSPYDRVVPIGPHGEFDSGPLPPGKTIWIQAQFMVARGSPERVILEWQHNLDHPTQKLHLRMNGMVDVLSGDQ